MGLICVKRLKSQEVERERSACGREIRQCGFTRAGRVAWAHIVSPLTCCDARSASTAHNSVSSRTWHNI